MLETLSKRAAGKIGVLEVLGKQEIIRLIRIKDLATGEDRTGLEL